MAVGFVIDQVAGTITFQTGGKITFNPATGGVTINGDLVLGDPLVIGGNNGTPGSASTIYGIDATADGANSSAFGDGAISTGPNTVVLGEQATAGAGASCVVIGRVADGSGSGGLNVVIGNVAQAQFGSSNTVIGSSASSASNNNVVIGRDSSAAASGSSVVVGNAASASAGGAVCIGQGTTSVLGGLAIGQSADATATSGIAIGAAAQAGATGVISLGTSSNAAFANSIAIGLSAVTTNTNQLVIGSSNAIMSDVYFGKGVTHATPTGFTVHGTGAASDNGAGASATIAGGISRGSGLGGSVIIQVSTSGAAAAVQNALITVVEYTDALSTFTGNVTVTGSVGIGTTAPATGRLLEVSGTGNQFVRVTSTDDSQTGIEFFRPDNADTDWRILNDGGSLFIKSSSDDFTSTSPKIAVRVGGDSLVDPTTVDISLLQLRVIRASNTNDQGMGIGFVHDTSNGNVGAAIVHERTGSASQGKLHFATKSSTTPSADIPIRMTIDENGLVGIGVVSPTSILSLQMGTGTGAAEASGKANVNTTAVGTDANTLEKDLLTYSLPANSLSADGKLVKITVWGTVTSASSKTIRLKFGATVIRDIATSSGGLDWRIDGTVIRTGAATQDAMATASLDTVAPDTTISTPAETLSGAVVIKLTGQNGTATANDIVAEGMLVEYLN